MQIEKQIVIGKAINFKDKQLFQTLKHPAEMLGAAYPLKQSNQNPINLIISSTFQMRTPNNMKASSTIVSPKLSLTAQTPSKDTLTKKGITILSGVSSSNQTGRKIINTDTKMGAPTQHQSASVRESFTKDKHLLSSDNTSEVNQAKPAAIQYSHFYYK